MRTITATLLALAAGGLSAADYKIDPTHIAAIFKISHIGYSWTYGRFNDVSGTIGWDEASGFTSARISIKTASVDTGTKKKDDHLKSGDFFNVVEFPEMTFVSTSVTPPVDGVQQVTGTFTLLGNAKEITIPVALIKGGKDPWGNDRVGFDAHFTIDRTAFGMTFMAEGSEKVDIIFAGEAVVPKE